MLRVGVVSFVNSRPLARGLEKGRAGGGYELRYLPPSRVADGLAAGDLDVGLVPSVEMVRIPDLVVMPGLAIAATHEVRSVLLVSRVPLAEIRRVALDENSRTSAALVKLLLAERYGVRPETVPAAPDVEAMLARADAALVIGDPALRIDRERHLVLDLAGEWLELTGLPFVFAAWAARREAASPGLAALLAASLETGLAELDAIVDEVAAETGLPRLLLHDYYTRNLRFRMGLEEERGLREFLRRAEPELAPRLRFFAASEG